MQNQNKAEILDMLGRVDEKFKKVDDLDSKFENFQKDANLKNQLQKEEIEKMNENYNLAISKIDSLELKLAKLTKNYKTDLSAKNKLMLDMKRNFRTQINNERTTFLEKFQKLYEKTENALSDLSKFRTNADSKILKNLEKVENLKNSIEGDILGLEEENGEREEEIKGLIGSGKQCCRATRVTRELTNSSRPCTGFTSSRTNFSTREIFIRKYIDFLNKFE